MVIQGLALFIIFGALLLVRVPVAFALIGACLVFLFTGERLTLWLLDQRLFFGTDSFVLLAVPLFILSANIMNRAQVTARLIELANALFGWIRGGLGMVTVGASMIFAGISGSSTAEAAAIGGSMIPSMLNRGYSPRFAIALTASASVIGTIIPPSIQMVVWGALTNTSVAAMFLGGVVPGILVGSVQMIVVYYTARRDKYPVEHGISARRIVKAGSRSILALGVPAVVVGGIVFGIVTPTEAAVLAVLYSLFLGIVVYRTLPVSSLPEVFKESAQLAALPLFALAAASVFSYLLSYYQVPDLLKSAIGDVSPSFLLIAIVACWLVIGTFLDALPAMVLLVPIFAPLVTSAGIDPVHYGVVSVMALAVGLITPPYGLCLLLASAIGEIPVSEAIKGLWPFLVGFVIVILVTIYLPDLVLWLPRHALDTM